MDDIEKQRHLQVVWDFMLVHHTLKKADAIVVLGSFDTNVGVYAAELYLAGWAPVLVCAGSGTVNQQTGAYQDFVGSTEAEVNELTPLYVCTCVCVCLSHLNPPPPP